MTREATVTPPRALLHFQITGSWRESRRRMSTIAAM